jgi:excisionase family DNA binding protein
MRENKLLTVKEAARTAGVSAALIYQLCDERRLPHYRLGGRGRRGKILIDQDELDKFVASCKVTEPPDDDGELQFIR